ncbi:MAG: transferrin-binding protein-like solute binding protein [Rhodobacteraceae bacterium]|nr:transferrin-binding protein-like solute binding protein [Paracoccaceae bacterium]
MLYKTTAIIASTLLISACSGGVGPSATISQPSSATAGAQPNSLPQSGQGNSGGVVSGDGPAAAGVEATMRYNRRDGVARAERWMGAQVEFHNGDLTGVSINCSRAGGGAVVPECQATNAEKAWLVNELSGSYAYAGGFAVEGHGTARDQDSFVTVHSGPGMNPGEAVTLPGESVDYRGQFQAGAGLTVNGTHHEGRVTGSVDLTADFASGALSADFGGSLYDETIKDYVRLDAGFEDAVIGQDGRFFNTADTTFSYNGSQAWGELDGAFYGPNAEEAAGTFGFGNASGGMTGIMLGCTEYNPSNCVAPAPRF